MSTLNFMEKLLGGSEAEWKTLGDVAIKISSGGTPKTDIREYWEGGTIPWMSSGEVNFETIYETENFITEAGLKNSSAKFVPKNSLVIALAGQGKTRGKVARTRIELTTNQSLASIVVNEAIVNSDYLYHFLKTQYENLRQISSGSGTRGGLNLQMISSYRFPLPCPDNPKKSLEIQAEIVRILDKFDALTNSITEGLPREIALRQQQYEYYRDKLLTFEEGDVEWKTLGEVANIKNGKDWKSLGAGNIPVYGSGGIMQYVDTFAYDKPTVLIPRKGSITNIFYVDSPFWNVDTIYYTEVDTDQIIPKFFYYFMTTINMMQLDTGSGRPSLTQAILNEIKVPLPTLSEQARIVTILDKFDALTHSLTEGLPREIQLHQQQYEYYRDQLLTFEEGEVEWKTLGEVATLKRGRVMSKGYLVDNAGDYPVYSSQTVNNGMIGRIDTFDFEGEYISWTTDGANAGTVFYRTGKFSITNVCGSIKINNESKLNYKFLFYWLSIEAQKHVYSGMGNPKLMSHQVEKIPIPIPCPDNPKKSLEIQAEIVRILDAFTELTAELTTELTTELSLRKKQYNHYRDQLLSFEEGEVEWRTLGEVANIQRGASPRPIAKYVTDDEDGVPWIKIGDTSPGSKYVSSTAQKVTLEGAERSRILNVGDFIMSNSMSFGRPYILGIRGAIHDGWASISSFGETLNSDYLYHYLSSNNVQNYWAGKINSGSVSNLNADIIKTLPIPIPDLSEQEKIATILDKFDALTNSITEGLPREIQLRQQQYNHYRDQLLSFPKPESEVVA